MANEYDDLINAEQSDALNASMYAGLKQHPDTEAQLQKLSERTGVPLEVVRMKRPEVEVQEKLANFDYEKVIKETPKLSAWLADPKNAALAHDDWENLSALERAFHSVADYPRALAGGLVGDAVGRTLSGAAELIEVGARAVDRPINYLTGANPFETLVTAGGANINPIQSLKATGKNIKTLGDWMKPPTERQNLGTDVAGGIGQIGGQIATHLLTGGLLTVPTMLAQGADVMAEKTAKDVADPALKDAAILAGGAITAITEKYGLDKILNRVPPEIKNRTLRFIADKVAAGGIEAGQEFTEGLLHDLTRRVLTNKDAEVLEGVEREMTAAALSAAIVRTALGVKGHARAKEQEQFVKSLTDTAAASKLRDRMPERFQQYLDSVTAGGPVENIFVPADRFATYFQEAGMDPAVEASKLGVQNFAEAQVAGTDVVIPTSEFVTQLSGTDHLQGLWNDLRFNQAEMTFREAREFEMNRGDQQIDAETLQRMTGANVGDRSGFEEIKQQMLGELAGRFDTSTAEAYATQYAAAITTLAERAGTTPQELHARYDLSVNMPMPDGLRTLLDRVDIDIDPMLDRLRAGDIPSARRAFGASLSEFIREGGGLRESGESRHLDEAGERLPGQKKFSRPDGMDIDMALEAAVEAGYFPGRDSQAMYDSELLDAIADDLNGNKIYSAHYEADASANEMRGIRAMQEWLDSLGADVTKMSNAEIRALIERSAAQDVGDVYEQNTGNKRGSITISPDGRMRISLFEKANLSTFLHEVGHFYLEVLGDLASQEGAAPQLVEDYATIKKWMGIEDGGAIEVKHHEMFARANEAYLMSGKAPNPELQGIFRRFRDWLKQIYKSIAALDVPMSAEINGVFDRIYATDEQIEAARNEGIYTEAFATAADAGMTEAEFQAYRSTVAQTIEQGQERLQTKLMAELTRERTAQWKAERERMQEAVEAEVDAEPVYAAFKSLKDGALEDGTPIKLSREDLVRLYGKEFLKRMPRGFQRIYQAEGGVDVETAAEIFGFDNGRALVDQLVNMQPRDALVESITDQRMKEMFGDIRFDGSIADEANRALHNDKREDMLKIELRAIRRKAAEVAPTTRAIKDQAKADAAFAKREREYERRWMEAEKNLAIDIERGIAAERIAEIRQGIADEKAALKAEKAERQAGEQFVADALPQTERTGRTKDGREYTYMAFDPAPMKRAAAGIIGQKAVRDVRPMTYLLAERDAAKEFAKAMKAKDYMTAAEQKQRELFNHYLYKEATTVAEEVQKKADWLREQGATKKRQALGKAGADYLEQVDEILERYEFKTVPLNKLDRRQSLAAWVNAQEAAGNAISVPEDVLNEARRVNWKQVPVDELRAVYDSVRNITHLARWKNKLLVKDKRRSYEDAKAEMLAGIANSGFASTGELSTPNDRERNWRQKGAKMWRAFDANLIKTEQLVEWLDRGQINGPWHEYFFGLADAAQTKEYDLHRKVTMALNNLRKEMPNDWAASLDEKLPFDLPMPVVGGGTAPMKVKRFTMLSIALNMGNEQNMQRLRDGNQISDVQMQKIRESMTDADWRFVQGVWDAVELLWPDMAALEKRASGLEPVKVDAQSFEVRGTTYRGGYFPLVYDRRLGESGEKQADADATIQAFLSAGIGRPTTNKGATKTRNEVVNAPLVLDMNFVLGGHIAKVVKDISHREAVGSMYRLISDTEIKTALIDRLGEDRHRQMLNFVKVLVTDRADTFDAATGIAKFAMHTRTNVAVMTMGLKATTVFSQFAGFGPTFDFVKRGHFFDAFVKTWKLGSTARQEAYALMYEKSGEMRHRAEVRDRDVRDALRRIADKQTPLANVQRVAFYFTALADKQVAGATWLGAYNQTIAEGRTDEDAVAYADKAVRLSQGAGGAKDLAAIQRNTEFTKLLTMFYTPFSVLYARLRDIGHQQALEGIGYLPTAVARAFWLVAFPAIAGEVLAGRGPDDDEDETWWAVRQMMLYPIAAIPVVRDFAGLVEQKMIKVSGDGSMDYSPSYQLSPIVGAINKAWTNLVSKPIDVLTGDRQFDAEMGWKMFEATGVITGLPTSQVTITGSYLTDLLTGEAQPENAGEILRDSLFRRKKD